MVSRGHLSAVMSDEPPTPMPVASEAAASETASQAASPKVVASEAAAQKVVASEAAAVSAGSNRRSESGTGVPALAEDSRPNEERSNSMLDNTQILSHADV